MLVRLRTLDLIFSENKDQTRLTSDGKCCDCGRAVNIDITRTSGGFGLNGGVLYEPRPGKIIVKCTECYRHRPLLTSRSGQSAQISALTLHKFS
jgi:hypothetical protein